MSKQEAPKWLDPYHPSLTGDTGRSASQAKVSTFPEVVRSQRDQPIPQQSMGLVSFMLFKEPKKLQTGTNAYGFFKIRGNYSDVDIRSEERRVGKDRRYRW